MLTADVRFEGWTTESWSRFLDLWKPRAPADREVTRPRGGLFIIHDGTRVLKVLHSRRGRIAPSLVEWPSPLARLAETHEASWALAAQSGALEELMERFGSRLDRAQNFTEQSLTLIAVARQMMAEGHIERWPKRLHGLPQPTAQVISRSLDAVCPDGHCIAFGMWKRGEIWTAAAARRRGAEFDVIAGPSEVLSHLGPLSGDWRRDYRHLSRAISEKYGPVAFGCFAEVERFKELQTDREPGAWGRAFAVRDIVLAPVPLAVGMAIGADGARLAVDRARIAVGRWDSFGLLEPFVDEAKKRLQGLAGDKNVTGLLGFDPMAALRALLER